MLVKNLMSLLSLVPENTPVLIMGHDHTYDDTWAADTTALEERKGIFIEDGGEDLTPESKFGKRTRIISIGSR